MTFNVFLRNAPRPARGTRCMLVLMLSCLAARSADADEPALAELGRSLTFHASFDAGPDAEIARGERLLFHAPAMNRRTEARPGLPEGGEVSLEPQGGRFGGALRFRKSQGPIVFYRAERNLGMPRRDWAGTVSFWLSTDPAADLPDGFCDPMQITSKQWDDAAMFVEFEKRPAGIPFRLGVYADKSVWNPTGRKFEDIPAAERPLAAVEKPPFAAGKWTHVAFTFSQFNTDRPEGQALLYLDGRKAGEIAARQQSFSWEAKDAAIMLGLSYIGRMDDLALFDRSLSADEVAALFGLKHGVSDLKLPK